jgi:hypothetical protein
MLARAKGKLVQSRVGMEHALVVAKVEGAPAGLPSEAGCESRVI